MRYVQYNFSRFTRDGFALPTVLITAVIMMIVLVTGMSASGVIETALKSQYYNQLAREAAESDIATASTAGNNKSGQLGDGTTTNSSTPAARRYTNILPVTIS